MQSGPRIKIGTPQASAALSAWHRRWEDPDDEEDEDRYEPEPQDDDYEICDRFYDGR
jgi:hypothetical protein